MNKLKVTHCVSSIDKMEGGPSRSVPLLCKGLSKYNLDVELVTYDSEKKNDALLKNSNVDLTILPKEHVAHSFSLNFKKYLHSINKQIFHIHGTWSPFYHWATKHARDNNIPYIISPRGNLEPWCLNEKKYKKKLALWLYQNEDLKHASCIYTSGELEAYNIRSLGYPNPIAIIPNGIDISTYPFKNKQKDKEKRQILFLSRIHPKKGLDLLIKAWKDLAPIYSTNWNIAIVGNGERAYINHLNHLIERLDIQDSVQILPPTFGKEKIDLYHNSDLFVLPTYSENFGMVIAEAMACGLPVITTKNTPWGCIEKEKCGWWINLSLEELKRTLIEALNTPLALLEQMGVNSRNCIETNFSLEITSSMTYELYQWLIGNTDKPAFVI